MKQIILPITPTNFTDGMPFYDSGYTHTDFQYSHYQLTWYKIPRRLNGQKLGLRRRRTIAAQMFMESLNKQIRSEIVKE